MLGPGMGQRHRPNATAHAKRGRKALHLPEGLDDRAAVQGAHLALPTPRHERTEVLPGLSGIGGTSQPPVLDGACGRFVEFVEHEDRLAGGGGVRVDGIRQLRAFRDAVRSQGYGPRTGAYALS